MYVRLQDIKTRSFSLPRLWRGIRKGDPWEAFRGNFSQREVMMRGPQPVEAADGRSARSGCAIRVRNLTSLRQGSPVDIDFSITGPDIAALEKFSEELRRKAAGFRASSRELRALSMSIRRCGRTSRSCWCISTGSGRRRWAWMRRRLPRRCGWRWAATIACRGIAMCRSMTRTTWSCGWWGSTGATRSRSRSFTCGRNPRVLERGGGDGALVGGPVLTRIDNVVSFERGKAPARIDRLDRQRMVAIRANVAPGFALGEPDRRPCRRPAKEIGHAAGL